MPDVTFYINDHPVWRDDADDIGAVRVEYDGRTYHLVADDTANVIDLDDTKLYDAKHEYDPSDYDHLGRRIATPYHGSNDDVAGDDLDRLRNDVIDTLAHLQHDPPRDDADRAFDAACAALRRTKS